MACNVIDFEKIDLWVERFTKSKKKYISFYWKFGPDKQILCSEYVEYKDKVKNITIREDDVWVLGFPRSGTTLTQEMVWLLGNDLNMEKAKELNLAFRSVFLENGLLNAEDLKDRIEDMGQNAPFNYLDFDVITNLPSPRFYKSHLSLSLLPDDLLDKAKVVYVVRNVRDVMVSVFYLVRLMRFEDKVDFKTFWKCFIEDQVGFVPYFKILKRAWNNKNHPNMLILFYEDMIKDLKGTVLMVSKFLNKQYAEEQIDQLCEHLSFDSMKNNTAVQPNEIKDDQFVDKDAGGFIRKGKVGGWRQHFDDEMIKITDEWIAENLADTDFKFRD